ncbi:MAG: DEAD/DEAH box helicase family protein [Planctomycetaceae bacterium]|nr:DEAD/DEAH box helicase family protein [Planctomycetaceae bacterium]
MEGGFVVHGDRIEPLEDFEVFEWIRSTRGDTQPVFTESEAPGVVHELMTLPTVPRLHLPERWKLEEKHVTPRPRLKLFTPSLKGTMPRDRIQGDIEFVYDRILVRGSTHSWALPLPDEQSCLVRDIKMEQACWGQLQSLGVLRIDDRGGNKHDVQVPLNQLTNILRELFTSGWEILSDEKPFRQPGEVAFRVESGIDWFDVTGEVQYGGTSVSIPVLLSALARGDRTVQLDDGSLGFVPEEWKERFGVLLSLAESDGDGLRFTSSQAALVDALLSTQTQVDFDEKFLLWRQKLAEFNGVSMSREPASFQGELRDYQREGLGWLKFLEEFQFGGCLADDMGLGKTIMVLALLERRRTQQAGQRRPSLIVVPRSLVFNWLSEGAAFAPKLRMLDYTGPNRGDLATNVHGHDAVVTTYGTVRREALQLQDIEFDYLILDEAQAIKNHRTAIAKAVRLLNGRHRLALSGTPIENRLLELWSLFEFLNPGMLGSRKAFKDLSAPRPGNQMPPESGAAGESSQETCDLLARAIRPFVLRRTKAEVVRDLPPKTEQTIYCDLTKRQRRQYDELREYYRAKLLETVSTQGWEEAKFLVLQALVRLRQAACHSGLVDPKRIDEPSAKVTLAVDRVSELAAEGYKVLVFSQFTAFLGIVRERLDARGIVHEYLDGRTRDRAARVARFQNDPRVSAFLISLKAGGVGLNLTAAEHVLLLDPWWNPAVEAQAIDRAHRIGQTRPVLAWRIVARDTVEERILELQAHKRSLADAIIRADTGLVKELRREDLEVLLG